MPKLSAVRVDEGGGGGGQRREENVLKSMRELGELLIFFHDSMSFYQWRH